MILVRARLRHGAIRCLLLAVWGFIALPAAGLAQSRPPDLSQVSIEDLMSIEVTSASRKEQRTEDVAAAVFVITHDDIRRSGMTTIPDLLRLAPGVEVAQINSNKWAVSVRGFNGLFANKLLVLIDGRSVYNRIFAGVLWDSEDLMVDDIDHIEVIRGPGATIWGANAVNGVINIVTKASADTLGALVRADLGSSGEQGAVRYGGAIGHQGTYRVYSQWSGRDESVMVPGIGANDPSHSITTGFRSDWTARTGAFMLEGDYTSVEMHSLWPNLDPQTAAADPIATAASSAQGGQLVARWTLTRDNGATLQVQSALDIARRQEPVGSYVRNSFGFDTQYHTALAAHQDLVAGVGYRYIDEDFFGHVGISLTPAEGDSSLLTAFAQDEVALFRSRLAVTLGSQVQYDSDFGAGIQPTARVMWKGLRRQRVWAAASRALRTPSLTDRSMRVDFPPVATASGLPLFATALGNPDAATETFVDVEAGYRLEIGTAGSIDVTGFEGRYSHLQTQDPSAPIIQFVPSPAILVVSQVANLHDATTRGLEISGHWMVAPAWRVDGSYTGFHVTAHDLPAGLNPVSSLDDGSAPRTQWQLRSAFSPVPRATVNVAVFHVGRLEQLQVEAYTRTDLSAEWRFSSRLSAMAVGQNLFDAAHAEFGGGGSLLLATQVPRSASLRLRWTFR